MLQFNDGSSLSDGVAFLVNTARGLTDKIPKDPKIFQRFLAAPTVMGIGSDNQTYIFYGIEAMRLIAGALNEAAGTSAFCVPINPADSCMDIEVMVELCRDFKGGHCYKKHVTSMDKLSDENPSSGANRIKGFFN